MRRKPNANDDNRRAIDRAVVRKHAVSHFSTTELVELLLKDQRRLDALIATMRSTRPDPPLLAVAWSASHLRNCRTLIMNLGYSIPNWVPRAHWYDGTWANLTLAYVIAWSPRRASVCRASTSMACSRA